MTTMVLLHYLGASFLAGVATTVLFFSFIVSQTNGHRSKSCVLRLAILLIVGFSLYLFIEGKRLAG